jgi:putative membrane protein
MTPSDPRVFFAAERTLLAWLRTGLTVIGLGFVVARFGLFLRLVSAQAHATPAAAHSTASAVLGVLFVLAGSIAILFAAVQHKRYVATLPVSDLPSPYSRGFAVVLSIAIGVFGLLLAAYLVTSDA